jgi:hypothetical protein
MTMLKGKNGSEDPPLQEKSLQHCWDWIGYGFFG